MDSCRGSLFQKRHFAADIIVTWCAGAIVFRLSLRDVEELMAERGLSVDHTTIWPSPTNHSVCLRSAKSIRMASQGSPIMARAVSTMALKSSQLL